MKVLAFYLPQYHRTKENDEWWGEGFTEWTNMKNAKPLFGGHQQPKIPENNDYYDLLDVNVMKKQIAQAKKKGIYGFCVYHYWFGSRPLLEKPMENYLYDCECDFPFCFSWANETWTNAWATDNKAKRKVLIKQEYGNRDEWERHFKYLLPFFQDQRYIKQGNKPIFVIYRPQYISKLKERLNYYNRRAKEEGFDGIVFCAQHVSYYKDATVDKSVIDYRIEYQPGYAMQDLSDNIKRNQAIANIRNWLKDHGIPYPSLSKKKITFYGYDELWTNILKRKAETDTFPGAFVNWDNSPRYGIRAKICTGTSVEKFYEYFKKLIVKAREEYKSDYIFIFAWNEWSEGGILESDNWFGDGFLNAIHRALCETNELPEE